MNHSRSSWVLTFSKTEWQPPSLSTMSLKRWFASLYSRESLSSVSRLAARSVDSARQGYSTEKSPQGRCRGESKLRWWTTRWNYTHQDKMLFLPSVPSPRSHLRPSVLRQSRVHRNPSPWFPASRRRNGPAPTGRATAGRGRLSANEDTANLRGISRHVVTATAVTGERASGTGQVPLVDLARGDVPSPAVSQRRRTPVRRALPLATARDDERAPTGRVGRLLSDGSSSYPLRSPRPMRNALSQWLPLQLDRFILNRPQQLQSRPR